ncbi:MAG TPA: hypothetical protein VLB31_05620, partial [Actinomycetota bacterium]|nr:hypothetical protein [Actinomycetota bacterium]
GYPGPVSSRKACTVRRRPASMPDVRVDDIVDFGEVARLPAVAMDNRWLSPHVRDSEARHLRVIFTSLIAAGYPPRSLKPQGAGIMAIWFPVWGREVGLSVGVALLWCCGFLLRKPWLMVAVDPALADAGYRPRMSARASSSP